MDAHLAARIAPHRHDAELVGSLAAVAKVDLLGELKESSNQPVD
jgi:hypothetical protein